MKKLLFPLILFCFFGCCSKELIVNDDFLNDLASENNKLAGQLYWDVYNKNLDTLSYDAYINYLKVNVAPAEKGLYEKIIKAKTHLFKTKGKAFLLILFYYNENEIICDNSSTTIIDSVHIYKPNEPIPSLKEFSDKIKF